MQQSQLPLWIQYIQVLGPSFVTILAASIAGYIAWRQWKTANHKLRLDVYERRYAIYREVTAVLANTLQQGTVTYGDVTEFYRKVRGAEFLFGQEVEVFIENVRDTLNKLAYHEGRIKAFNESGSQNEVNYGKHVDSAGELMMEIELLLMKGARLKFEPYLSFSHLK